MIDLNFDFRRVQVIEHLLNVIEYDTTTSISNQILTICENVTQLVLGCIDLNFAILGYAGKLMTTSTRLTFNEFKSILLHLSDLHWIYLFDIHCTHSWSLLRAS